LVRFIYWLYEYWGGVVKVKRVAKFRVKNGPEMKGNRWV